MKPPPRGKKGQLDPALVPADFRPFVSEEPGLKSLRTFHNNFGIYANHYQSTLCDLVDQCNQTGDWLTKCRLRLLSDSYYKADPTKSVPESLRPTFEKLLRGALQKENLTLLEGGSSILGGPPRNEFCNQVAILYWALKYAIKLVEAEKIKSQSQNKPPKKSRFRILPPGPLRT